MRKKKKTPISQKKKPGTSARFGVGNLVRVKPGTTDPDFLDIPLGGGPGVGTKLAVAVSDVSLSPVSWLSPARPTPTKRR